MHLRKLALQNYCNHKKREITFERGLTAITGRNGSGKSNVMDGVRLALTGKSANYGKKSDNICCLAGKKEQAYVELEFEHAGTNAVVRRWLRPAQPATLQLADGSSYVGDNEVSRILAEFVGVDDATMNTVVLVAQRDLFGFIDQTPAVRAKHFQDLFKTEQAERIYTAVNKYINGFKVTDWQSLFDSAFAQCLAAQQTAAEIKRLNPTVAVEANPFGEMLEQQRNLLHIVQQKNNLSRTIQDKSVSLGEQTALLVTLTEQRAKLLAEYQVLNKSVTDLSTQRDEALQLVAVAEATKKANAQYLAQEAKVQACLALLQDKMPVAMLEEQVESREIVIGVRDRELADLISRHGTLQQFLQNSVCPTCGTVKDSTPEQLAAKQQEAGRLATEIAELQRIHTEDKAVLAKTKLERNWLKEYTANYQNTRAVLEGMAPPQPVADTAAAEAVANAYAADKAKLAAVVAAGTSVGASIAATNATIKGLNESVAEAQAATQQLPEVAFTATELEAKIAELRQQSEQWTTFRANYVYALRQMEQKQAEVAEYQKKIADSKLDTKWLESLTTVSDIFHRDAAPKYVALQNMQIVEREINKFLELFDTEYRVAADENLSFVARFLDGREQLVERLSGGQAAIVALAFRLSVNTLFAGSLGCLFLDEPTAYQDEHHIRGFGPVISKLKEYSANRGLQCIIVTHEKDLAPLFDQTVDLG